MIDVLIPTRDRAAALAVTLTSLAYQERTALRVLIADQGERPVADSPEIQAIIRFLATRNVPVELFRNYPPRGLAHQRQALLERSTAARILFIDDDLLFEPWLACTLEAALIDADCGFVGSAVIGLSFVDDMRPDQQAIEFWDGPIHPERIAPSALGWKRHRLHNAANLLHVQQAAGATPAQPRLYKVAWVGGCVLYDRAKLLAAGGFEFWRDLPVEHVGEDVLAQLAVMAQFGGAGLLPSGAYHQELPTTVPNRTCDAPLVLLPV